MEFKTYDDRICYENTEGEMLAEIDFAEREAGIFEIYHTFVDEKLRGQHIASELVKCAIDEIHHRGGKVTASCSYAQAWMKKHQIAD